MAQFQNENAVALDEETVFDNNPDSEYYRMILTPCCGAHSTYSDGYLVCRHCYGDVDHGEGDGTYNLTQCQVDEFNAKQGN